MSIIKFVERIIEMTYHDATFYSVSCSWPELGRSRARKWVWPCGTWVPQTGRGCTPSVTSSAPSISCPPPPPIPNQWCPHRQVQLDPASSLLLRSVRFQVVCSREDSIVLDSFEKSQNLCFSVSEYRTIVHSSRQQVHNNTRSFKFTGVGPSNNQDSFSF